MSTTGASGAWYSETYCVNPLNAELILIRHLMVLLGFHHIPHVSRIRVKTFSEVSVFIRS